MRATAFVLVLTIALLSCTSTPTAPQVTCGTGTHDIGAGVCVIDNALVLNNLAGLNHWDCPFAGFRGSSYQFSFSSGGPTSGQGVYSSWDRRSRVSFTWQEGPGTNAMTITGNPFFDTLINIYPSSLTTPSAASRSACCRRAMI